MEVICQDRAGRDARLGEGCADGWKAGAAGCQAPLGFPSIWHRNVPSRGSAILPQLGRDSGDPQNAGGRELRGGAGWVKGHCWAFPQKAVVPKPAGPSLGHTVNSLPRKRPVVRPEGASGGKSLCPAHFRPGPPTPRAASLPHSSTSTSGGCRPGSVREAPSSPRDARLSRGGGGRDARGGCAGSGSADTHGPGSQLSPPASGQQLGEARSHRRPLGPPRAQSYLPGGGVSGANLSLLGAFLSLVAFLGGLGSGGRSSRSRSRVPAGSGGEKGSGFGSRRA